MAESKQESPKLSLTSLLVLAALVLVPGVFATGFTEFATVKEFTLLVCAALALAGWGFAVLRGRTIVMTGGRVVALLAAFAVYATLAIVWAPTWQIGAVPGLHWVAAATLFLVVTSPPGRPLTFADVAAATGAGAFIAGTCGLLDLMGVGVFTEVWDPPGAAGSFDAREFAVGYYAIALPFLAGAAIRTTGLPRIAAILGGVVGAAHFGLTVEMDMLGIWAGAILAVTLVLALLQGLVRLPLLYRPVLAAAVVGGLALGLASLKPTLREASDATMLPWVNAGQRDVVSQSGDIRDVRFAIRRTEEATNWAARSYVTGVAFDLFREEPIIGHGPGGWWAIQTKYFRQNEPFVRGIFERWPAFRSPHNSFATIMTELGGIGLLLFLMWISAIFGITITALARKEEPEAWIVEHWAVSSALVAGLAIAVFTPALDRAPAAVMAFVLAGLLVRESAALNDFKGLSQVWTINRDKKRFDTSLFCGVVPMALGAFMLVVSGLFVTVEFFRSWGDLAMLRAQHATAVDVYSRAEEIFPGGGEIPYNQALALKRLAKTDEAIELVNRAAQLRPYDVRIVNLLAAIHLGNHDYSDAATAARRAVELFPNSIEGRRNLTAALDLQGRFADAANELLAILQLEPPSAVAGRTHQELGEYYEGPLDNPAKALEHYQKAVPLLDQRFLVEAILPKIEELEKELERRRLMREGKPIPPSLMPGEDEDVHLPHGGGDTRDHEH